LSFFNHIAQASRSKSWGTVRNEENVDWDGTAPRLRGHGRDSLKHALIIGPITFFQGNQCRSYALNFSKEVYIYFVKAWKC
jgi:hypothetical protein